MFLPLRLFSLRSSHDVVQPHIEEESSHVAKGRALWLVSAAVCLLAVGAEPAAAQDDSGGLTPCIMCEEGCFEGGQGTICTPAPKGVNKGGTACRGGAAWVDDPTSDDPEDGQWHCGCVPIGELCVLRQSYSPPDREALGREATEVVASGGVLPADGLFFVGFRAGERVVRWKCDGSIAGRVTQADKPAERQSLGA